MKKLIYMAATAAFFAPDAFAQSIGTGNTFDPARDEIGIARDGTFEGYGTAASVLEWVQDNTDLTAVEMPNGNTELRTSRGVLVWTHVPSVPFDPSALQAAIGANAADIAAHIAADLDTDPTNELYDDTAVVADIADNAADIAAHVAGDADTDATNEIQIGDGVTITGTGLAGDPFVAVGDGTGTDDQALSRTGDTLTLEDGGTPIDLSDLRSAANLDNDPANEVNTATTIGAGPSYTVAAPTLQTTVTDSGGTITATEFALPMATATPCKVSLATGLVTDLWVSEHINRGHHYEGRTLTGVTTPCLASAIASQSASVTVTGGAGSVALASIGTEINGDGIVAIGVNGDITGQNVLSFGSNINAGRAIDSLLGGNNLNVENIGFSHVVASGTTITQTLAGQPSHGLNVTGHGHNVQGFDHTVGGENQTVYEGFANAMFGSNSSLLDANQSMSLGHNLLGAGIRQTLLIGTGVSADGTNTSQGSIVGGTGPLAASSANRRYYINGVTGNAQFAGSVSTNFVFPGFGEYAVGEIEAGQMVVFEGLAGVRLAREGERPDGVSREKLAMSAGGGIDPENAPYLLDAMGNRIMQEVEVKNDDGTTDDDGTTGTVVEAYVANPDYDPAKANDTARTGVEMLGRAWVSVAFEATVGSYVGAGGAQVEPDMGFRVLAVNEKAKLALVLVK